MSRYTPTATRVGSLLSLITVLFLSATLFGCVVAPYPAPPPPVMFKGPPHVVHIPNTYVYLVPGIDVNVFFYGGYWYRHHNNIWFRASVYSGPWVKVRGAFVPPRLHKLPGDFRRNLRPDAYQIPHADLKMHWKRWEKERHWDQVEKKRSPKKEKRERGR